MSAACHMLNKCAPPSDRRRDRRIRACGFTVIELIIVVAIVAILVAIAGPDFRSLIAGTRVKNASFDVFSTLMQARSEAITRNTTVTVTATGGNWASGWTIQCTDATLCINPVTAAPPLTIRSQDAYQGVTITSASATISFNGMGRASTSAAFTVTAPNATDWNKRCVTLDLSGRPVTKSPVTTGFACP